MAAPRLPGSRSHPQGLLPAAHCLRPPWDLIWEQGRGPQTTQSFPHPLALSARTCRPDAQHRDPDLTVQLGAGQSRPSVSAAAMRLAFPPLGQTQGLLQKGNQKPTSPSQVLSLQAPTPRPGSSPAFRNGGLAHSPGTRDRVGWQVETGGPAASTGGDTPPHAPGVSCNMAKGGPTFPKPASPQKSLQEVGGDARAREGPLPHPTPGWGPVLPRDGPPAAGTGGA